MAMYVIENGSGWLRSLAVIDASKLRCNRPIEWGTWNRSGLWLCGEAFGDKRGLFPEVRSKVGKLRMACDPGDSGDNSTLCDFPGVRAMIAFGPCFRYTSPAPASS